jgi:hypothetical protein
MPWVALHPAVDGFDAVQELMVAVIAIRVNRMMATRFIFAVFK